MQEVSNTWASASVYSPSEVEGSYAKALLERISGY